MHPLAVGLTFLSLFISKASAEFVGRPGDLAGLVFTGIWVIITLFQLICAIIYLCIARPGHRLFGPVFVLGLLLMFLSWVLYLISLAASTTLGFDIPFSTTLGLRSSETIFSYWSDALIILGIALIIRDRYVTIQAQRQGEKSASPLSRLPTWPIVAIFAFFTFLIIVLSSAYVGFSRAVDTRKAGRQDVNRGFFRALAGFYFLATFLLIPLSVVVKIYVKSDMIMNSIAFGVVPLCMLRAIVRVALLPLNLSTSLDRNFEAILAANVVVDGIFYAVALSILAYFFIASRLWGDLQATGNASQTLQVGFRPPEQFPGQWGYSGQPPQMPYAPPGMYYPSGQPPFQAYMTVPQNIMSVLSPPQTGLPVEAQAMNLNAGQPSPPQAQSPPSQAVNSEPQS